MNQNGMGEGARLALARKLADLCEFAVKAHGYLEAGLPLICDSEAMPQAPPGAMQIGPFVVVDLREVTDLKLVFVSKEQAKFKLPKGFFIEPERARWN